MDRKNQEVWIRQLTSEDADLYRSLRLEALEKNPEAFGSTLELEKDQPRVWFADRLSSTQVFAAFEESQIVGVAGFYIQKGAKVGHKGVLWGMYVSPGARKNGVGRRLLEAVIEQARGSVELLQLAVVSENVEARRLYVSFGFSEYGIEKRALKYGGRYFDEVLMVKTLNAES